MRTVLLVFLYSYFSPKWSPVESNHLPEDLEVQGDLSFLVCHKFQEFQIPLSCLLNPVVLANPMFLPFLALLFVLQNLAILEVLLFLCHPSFSYPILVTLLCPPLLRPLLPDHLFQLCHFHQENLADPSFLSYLSDHEVQVSLCILVDLYTHPFRVFLHHLLDLSDLYINIAVNSSHSEYRYV